MIFSRIVLLCHCCSTSFVIFQYNCFAAPLLQEGEVNFGWWSGRDGVKSYYWDGAYAPDEHICACGVDGSCIGDVHKCNCDSSAPEWLSDVGTLTNMSALPVKELRFGGLLFDSQEASFALGPLSCTGRKVKQVLDKYTLIFLHNFVDYHLSTDESFHPVF